MRRGSCSPSSITTPTARFSRSSNYTYDTRGLRVGMATHYGTWSYEYDDLGQITHAVLVSTDPEIPSQNLTFAYDGVGNRIYTISNGLRENYTTNNMNQYTQVRDT